MVRHDKCVNIFFNFIDDVKFFFIFIRYNLNVFNMFYRYCVFVFYTKVSILKKFEILLPFYKKKKQCTENTENKSFQIN